MVAQSLSTWHEEGILNLIKFALLKIVIYSLKYCHCEMTVLKWICWTQLPLIYNYLQLVAQLLLLCCCPLCLPLLCHHHHHLPGFSCCFLFVSLQQLRLGPIWCASIYSLTVGCWATLTPTVPRILCIFIIAGDTHLP